VPTCSEREHYEIERFSTLNKQIITHLLYYLITRSSKLKRLLSISSVTCTIQSL